MSSMITADDLLPLYGPYYFRNYRQAPYERTAKWLSVFGNMADGIVREIGPRRVLDVGCAMGFLVEALRDRGVDAFGVDLSPHAIDQVRDDIKPYCRVGSLLDPVAERFDLVVCIEVIEHVPPPDAATAVSRLCEAADDVLFSSTPDVYEEDTHLNVRPPEYWASLFATNGFIRDVDLDAAAFVTPWACRFRRSAEPMHRVTATYERKLWALTRETTALRVRLLQVAGTLAKQDEALQQRGDVARLQATVAEQQEHLDALNERLQFLSDHESELRRMLLDAHQQLAERDAVMLQQSIQPLQALVNERTAWAQRAVAELEECRKVAEERQALVDERTAWAQRAVAELQAYQKARFGMLVRLRQLFTRSN
jgi:SAM-dependent methyltransferase